MIAGTRVALSWIAAGALSVCAVVACSKPGEDSEAKRTPIPEPAPDVGVPAGWSIPVEQGTGIEGKLEASALGETKPDFVDEERKAWRLDRLLSDSEFPLGSLVEAIGADGVGIAMRREASADAPVPVIVLTRRGDVVAAAVKASDPFPNYHGQGGRLRRPGDPLPRLISPLARLRITTAAAPAKEIATMEGLRIQIGDSPPNRISPSLLASVASSKVMGDSGGTRTIWNARDVVVAAAGEGARLVEVSGDETASITGSDWADEAVRPVLQLNRRGLLKFGWHYTHARDAGTSEVKGKQSVHSVRVLRIER